MSENMKQSSKLNGSINYPKTLLLFTASETRNNT